ncbi:MAG: hypothetical protein AABX77_03680 [Nanoarchaeota archaeon]
MLLRKSNLEYDFTNLVLSYVIKSANGEIKETAEFRLPFAFDLKKGYRLSFYQPCITGIGIRHAISNYTSVGLYRGNYFLARFDGKTLNLLDLAMKESQ